MSFEIKMGADPEVFIAKGNVVVPAWGMVPGDKKKPHEVDKGAIQVDGLALEFNIDPAETAAEFSGNVQHVMDQLLKTVIAVDEKYYFSPKASNTFGAEVYRALPEEAKIVGCEPDINAYTERENPPGASGAIRHVGGHVHFSWTKDQDPKSYEHLNACYMLVKMFDLFVGIPSLILDPRQQPRRLSYGKSGNFRPKSYGVEYRTPSNFWIFKPELREWIFNQMRRAFDILVVDGKELYNDPDYQHVSPRNWWDAGSYEGSLSSQLKSALKKVPIDLTGGIISLEYSKEEIEIMKEANRQRKSWGMALIHPEIGV